MTCESCGSQCKGRYCKECETQNALENTPPPEDPRCDGDGRQRYTTRELYAVEWSDRDDGSRFFDDTREITGEIQDIAGLIHLGQHDDARDRLLALLDGVHPAQDRTTAADEARFLDLAPAFCGDCSVAYGVMIDQDDELWISCACRQMPVADVNQRWIAQYRAENTQHDHYQEGESDE